MQPSESRSFSRGTTIGRYVVLEILGRGGMGVVYAAYDPQIDRKVALKVLHAHLVSPGMRARFLREAQALGRLTHPNVVTVHDAGTFEEHVFMTMEYVAGRTLRAWLHAGPRSWRESVAVLTHAGRGLAAAHAEGIVHRDFKPDNVLIAEDGRVVVTDFGLAGGEDCDAQSDQFGFFATLYFALYGEPPVSEAPIDPPAGKAIPPWLRRVLKRGLSRRPAERFPGMPSALAALSKDPRAALGSTSVVVAIAVAAAAALWNFGRHERTELDACDDGGPLIAGTWNDGEREKIHGAFMAAGADRAARSADAPSGATDTEGTFRRVAHELDDYARRWKGAHRETCEATRVRHAASEEEMHLRFACLERRRTELGAVVGLFRRADAQIVGKALEASYGLIPPTSCSESGAKSLVALPTDPAEREHVLSARRALADADSLSAAGKLKESLASAQTALAEAQAAHHRGTEAEVLLHTGQVQEASGVYEAAIAPYARAVAAAEAAGDDGTLAQAAARIAFIDGDKLVEPEEAERWLDIAYAALSRLGPNEGVEAMVLSAHAPLPTAAGHPELALPLFERLMPISVRIYGADHPNTARALNNLGYAEQMLGRHAEALEAHKRAAGILERAMGPGAPMLAVADSNIGSSLIGLGRYEEAEDALERAAALAGNADPASFWVGWAMQYHGLAALRAGDAARALADVGRGLEIAEKRGALGAKLLPGLLTVQGLALTATGDATRGQASCDQAVALSEAHGPLLPERVYEWDALTCSGEALLARGHAGDAVTLLERSVALTRRVRPAELARAEGALARAEGALARATADGESARSAARSTPIAKREP